MSKQEKRLASLRDANTTFPLVELVSLMTHLGYQMQERSGSRVRFYNAVTGNMIRLHKPHPEHYLKGGALKAVRQALMQEGYL
jgi:hypothetical protein